MVVDETDDKVTITIEPNFWGGVELACISMVQAAQKMPELDNELFLKLYGTTLNQLEATHNRLFRSNKVN